MCSNSSSERSASKRRSATSNTTSASSCSATTADQAYGIVGDRGQGSPLFAAAPAPALISAGLSCARRRLRTRPRRQVLPTPPKARPQQRRRTASGDPPPTPPLTNPASARDHADVHLAQRPLSGVLSQALIAYTIEFDNEFERRMRKVGHPGFLSLTAWANIVRYLSAEGFSIGALAAQSSVKPKETYVVLGALERWGFVVLQPPAGPSAGRPDTAHRRVGFGGPRGLTAQWQVLPTDRTMTALGAWPSVLKHTEQQWCSRFGAESMDELRGALGRLLDTFDEPLPQGLPEGSDPPMRGGPPIEAPKGQPATPVLLAQLLWAFARDYDAGTGVPIMWAANVLRVLDREGVRVASLVSSTGLSPYEVRVSSQLRRSGWVEIVDDQQSARGKLIRLSPEGVRAQATYVPRAGAVEDAWIARFGRKPMARVRAALDDLMRDGPDGRCRITLGLVPPAGTPRAGVFDLGRGVGRPGVIRDRVRHLAAQTSAFIADPESMPHYPVWDNDRGFGP